MRDRRNVTASLPRGRAVLTRVSHYRRPATTRRRIQRSRDAIKARQFLRRLDREELR